MSTLDGPAIDQLEKCQGPFARTSCCVGNPSDEVVDRVMHWRSSIGLGWLKQLSADKQCEKTLLLFAASIIVAWNVLLCADVLLRNYSLSRLLLLQ